MAIQHSSRAFESQKTTTVGPQSHLPLETRFSTVIDLAPTAPETERVASAPSEPLNWAPPDPAQRSPHGDSEPTCDPRATVTGPDLGIMRDAKVTADLNPGASRPARRAGLGTSLGLVLLMATCLVATIAVIGLLAAGVFGIGRNESAAVESDLDLAAENSIPDDPATTGPSAGDRASTDLSSGEVDPYEFQVIEAVDVSTPQAERRGLAIEIDHFPIERDRLLATLDASVLGLAGEAHAVTVRVHHDRREHTPAAYGVWTWAPDGRWDQASEGDPATWDGYRWSAEFEPGKIDQPDRCSPLSDEELAVMGAFWPRVWATNQPKATIRNEIAATFGISLERFAEIETRNLAWNGC